jgi:hypothetical protein
LKMEDDLIFMNFEDDIKKMWTNNAT